MSTSRMTHRAPKLPAWRILGHGLSALLVLLVVSATAALVVVPKLTGSVPLTVLTGSMSPTYEPGSVVIVRPTPVEDLQIGDAITFQEKSGDPTVVTHRIVGIGFAGDGSREFITQGDANDVADPAPVTEAQVRGVVWYSVPHLGHVLTAVDEATRAMLLKLVALGLLLYGGYLVAAGARDSRRRRLVSAT